ncbi:cysteine hydrolase family protein [Rhizobium beringeri]
MSPGCETSRLRSRKSRSAIRSARCSRASCRPSEQRGYARHVAQLLRKMGHHDPGSIGTRDGRSVPSLKALVPPGRIFDKMTYSPWTTGELLRVLTGEGIETLAISGGETDVCVLAAALGAIDLGYRVILLKDAVCSGADDTHDASL